MVKVDSGIGMPMHGKCVGVDSGGDIRGGYSHLRHRGPFTMFFFVFGLWSLKSESSNTLYRRVPEGSGTSGLEPKVYLL